MSSTRKLTFSAAVVASFVAIVFLALPLPLSAEVRFADLSRFVLGPCLDLTTHLEAATTRSVLPRAGEGRVTVFGGAEGDLVQQVFVVCYTEREFPAPPADTLNGRVAAILMRFVEPVDQLDDAATVIDGTHLSRLVRSPLGLYARKELPEYYHLSKYEFAQQARLELGPFRSAGSSRVIVAQSLPDFELEVAIRMRTFGYHDPKSVTEIALVNDVLMGPKSGGDLSLRWTEKDLREFTLNMLKGWAATITKSEKAGGR